MPRWLRHARPDRRLTCRDVVELVTDYLDGTLDVATNARVAAHLELCNGCGVFVEQVRQSIAALQALPPPKLDEEVCRGLVEAFGAWSRGGAAR